MYKFIFFQMINSKDNTCPTFDIIRILFIPNILKLLIRLTKFMKNT